VCSPIVFATALADDLALVIEIQGKRLALPIAPSIVLGRLPSPPDPRDRRPHLDLSACDAQHQGVALEHIAISRKQRLVYVTDLDSLSGTQLNNASQRPYAEYVLRRGAVLRLGALPITVIFPTAPVGPTERNPDLGQAQVSSEKSSSE
jgi:FHA domain